MKFEPIKKFTSSSFVLYRLFELNEKFFYNLFAIAVFNGDLRVNPKSFIIKRIIVILLPFLLSSCGWDNELYDTFVNKDGTIRFCPELGEIGALLYIEKNESKCYRFDAVNVGAQIQKCKDEFDCCGLEREMARRYIHAFNNNICPKQYMCKDTKEPGEEHYYCKYSKCPIGFHVMPDSDECVGDTLTACGSNNNNCLEKNGMVLSE